MNKNRKILIIAYYFPPRYNGGAYRPAKFAKYLALMNWDVTVLTKDLKPNDPVNQELIKDLPKKVKIIRVPEKGKQRLNNIFGYPDAQIFWANRVVDFFKQNLQQNKYDLVFTTSFPISVHVAGLKLKQKYGLPWIADFRDPWLSNYFYQPKSWLHKVRDKKLELEIYKNADYIIENTRLNLVNSSQKYKFIKNKVDYIYNGFDLAKIPKPIRPKKNQKFLILYTGSIYDNYNSAQFLETLLAIKADYPKIYADLNVEFYGYVEAEEKNIKKLGLADIITMKSYLAPSLLNKKLLQADCFLVFLPEKVLGWVPQKVFLYLPYLKPMLAFLNPQSEAGQIIKDHSFPVFLNKTPAENAKLFKHFYKKVRSGKYKIPKTDIKQFSRLELTKKLEKIMQKILKSAKTK